MNKILALIFVTVSELNRYIRNIASKNNSADGTLSRIAHTLGHQTSHNTFRLKSYQASLPTTVIQDQKSIPKENYKIQKHVEIKPHATE